MRISKNNFFVILLFLAAVMQCFVSRGQNTVSSPYSKYGIGETDMFKNSVNAAMGGVGYAMHRNNMVNNINPASYSAIDSMSFVFDIGFYTNNVILRSNTAKTTGSIGGISHIMFAFPVHKTTKIAGGLLPVSSIDFTSSETHIGDTVNIGTYKATYAGDGGVNKAFVGVSFQPGEKAGFLHNLSIGANISYLFGNYYRSSTLSFPDSAYHLSSRIENNYKISAFAVDFGLQYFQTLKNGDVFGIGIAYDLANTLPTENQYRHYTYSVTAGVETIRDSVRYQDTEGEIKYPQTIGVGLSYERPQKLFAEIDATFTEWSKLEIQSAQYTDVLKDDLRISAGIEYKPNVYGNYLQKISYRFGLNYSSGMLYLNDRQIRQYGIALGFGLPIKKQGTQINICFEYGKQGTKESNLIEKDFFKIGVSFSAKDRWFFKRKYQ